MKKKVAFVINPASGIRRFARLEDRILRSVDRSRIQFELSKTEYPGHGYELSKTFASEGYDAVVAVGGDGSLNETGRALVNTRTAMGIIPTGSGNGLARSLRIPLKPGKAIDCINHFQTRVIDTASFNGHFFCNMAGIGFDGTVARVFEATKSRGFRSYIRAINSTYWSYPRLRCSFIKGKETVEREVLMVSFANSSQFGNGAKIAPQALLDDGLLDVCIMRKPRWVEAPLSAFLLMTSFRQPSHLMEYVRAKSFDLLMTAPADAHIDGEPLPPQQQVSVRVRPASLRVVVGRNKYISD